MKPLNVLKAQASCNKWLIWLKNIWLLTYLYLIHIQRLESSLWIFIWGKVLKPHLHIGLHNILSPALEDRREVVKPHTVVTLENCGKGKSFLRSDLEIVLPFWKKMFGPNYGSIIFCDQLWKWRIKHLFCLSSASSYTHVFNFLSFFIFHGRCVFSYKTYDSNNTPIFERLLYSWVNSWYYWELLNVELEATTEWLLTLWGRIRAFFSLHYVKKLNLATWKLFKFKGRKNGVLGSQKSIF